MNLRKLIFSSVLALCAQTFAFVAPKRPESKDFSWRILENAQVEFDLAHYGEAMNLANRAKQNRCAEVEWEVYVLEGALSPLAVRRAGEFFDDVLKVLRERDEHEAVALIEKYVNLYGVDFYGNSVYGMLDWVKAKAVYPEADFLIGKIYQIEGEFGTAYNFFEKARLERDYLDIPDTHFDILYSMVNLARESRNLKNYEEALLLILDSDPRFHDTTFQDAYMRILSLEIPENADRFFMLFRADSSNSLNALYELGNLRYSSGKLDDAIRCSALGTIEAFTHIYETLTERDTTYSFTTFEDFLEECGKYDDILEWCESNHVWEMMFQMVDRVGEGGNSVLAENFFRKISDTMPDAYWRAEAKAKLSRR